jgi:hypothetical protein
VYHDFVMPGGGAPRRGRPVRGPPGQPERAAPSQAAADGPAGRAVPARRRIRPIARGKD